MGVVAVGLAGSALAQGGMPPELRDNIHTLFDRHSAIRRTVTPTKSGYVSVTETDEPRLASVLQSHVAQMEARLKDGLMVRRWDPAFPEYIRHYGDMDVKVESVAKGVRVTVRGRTPEAVKVAQNHARVIDDFVAHGWQAHDRSHPAALAGGARPGSEAKKLPESSGHHGTAPSATSADGCRGGGACCAEAGRDRREGKADPMRRPELPPRGPELRKR